MRSTSSYPLSLKAPIGDKRRPHAALSALALIHPSAGTKMVAVAASLQKTCVLPQRQAAKAPRAARAAVRVQAVKQEQKVRRVEAVAGLLEAAPARPSLPQPG